MSLIEERLEAREAETIDSAATPDQTMPYQNGHDNHHLLSLVEALDANTLNDDQRELVAELRCGILALTQETGERPSISC
jgi:hypothetical protein